MLNLASKYFFIFDDIQIYLLLDHIEKYVNGAELQINRIERTGKLIERELLESIPKGTNRTITDKTRATRWLKFFCDIHYYFICIGQVNKCFKRLYTKLKNKSLSTILNDFQSKFKQEIRNDLEHYDERITGKIRGNNVGHIVDLGNYRNGNFTFNGKSYPVNKNSLKRLKEIYKNIILLIHNDYALKNVNFVENMNRDLKFNKTNKIAQKEFPEYFKPPLKKTF